MENLTNRIVLAIEPFGLNEEFGTFDCKVEYEFNYDLAKEKIDAISSYNKCNSCIDKITFDLSNDKNIGVQLIANIDVSINGIGFTNKGLENGLNKVNNHYENLKDNLEYAKNELYDLVDNSSFSVVYNGSPVFYLDWEDSKDEINSFFDKKIEELKNNKEKAYTKIKSCYEERVVSNDKLKQFVKQNNVSINKEVVSNALKQPESMMRQQNNKDLRGLCFDCFAPLRGALSFGKDLRFFVFNGVFIFSFGK